MRAALALLVLALLGAAAPTLADEGKVKLHLELSHDEIQRGAGTGVEVFAEIDRGWHIQAHKPSEKFLIASELTVTAPAGIAVEDVLYPRPDPVSFSFAGGKSLLVYEGKVGMSTALHVPADYAGTEANIEAALRYQACDDESCLPPVTAKAALVVPIAKVVSTDTGPVPTPKKVRSAGGIDVEKWMREYGFGLTLGLVALLGLTLNLTPCVYPLISVTVSFFGGQAHGTHARVAWLASLYVAGIALTFSAVGVAGAMSGELFGAALQKPPVLLAIAAMMVVLALSSFGLYTLQPPPAVMRVVGRSSGGAFGALFMGLTMGIVAAPCVGPIVLGLLVFVGARQDPLLGFALFLALSLGMGLPYLVLAMMAGSIRTLPRSGEWLVWTERLFGCVLLILAVYFIEPLLPPPLSQFAIPLVVVAAGLYLGFVDGSGARLRYFTAFKRSAGLLAVAAGVWAAVPQGVDGGIPWEPYNDTAFAAARQSGSPVVLDFGAEWCLPCKEMEKTTFVDPAVLRATEKVRMFRVDLTEENEENERITAAFEVRGVPTTIFFSPKGEEVERAVGYVGPDEMLALLRRAS